MSSEWNSETGFYKPLATYPYRVHSAGHRGGVHVLLQSYDRDTDYMCRGSATGFTVTLHAPYELPHTTKQFEYVPDNVETVITVTPDVFTISDDLVSYNWKRYNYSYFDWNTFFRMLYVLYIHNKMIFIFITFSIGSV